MALPGVVVLGCAVAFWQWERLADAEIRRAEQAGQRAPQQDTADGSDAGESVVDPRLKKYGGTARPRRTGSTVFRLTRKREGVWLFTVSHRMVLLPGDPLTAQLRKATGGVGSWIPFDAVVNADYGTGDETCSSGWGVGDSDTDELRQDGPGSTVYASAHGETLLDFVTWCDVTADASTSAVLDLTPRSLAMGKKGYFDEWTITVATDDLVVTGVDGATVLRQSGHRVELRLPARRSPQVQFGAPYKPPHDGSGNDIADLAWVLQSYSSALREAFFALGAVTAVGCIAVAFVRRWAPPVTRRRWIVVAWMGTGLTCVTLLWAALDIGATDTTWWATAGQDVPLMIWWQTLLPLVTAAFVVRVARGRPPRTRDLTPVLVPSALLSVPAVLFTLFSRSPMPVLIAVVAACTAVAVLLVLRRGLLGPTGRRWAVTAASAVWLVLSAAGPGIGLPDLTGIPGSADPDGWALARLLTESVLAWAWPAALWVVLSAYGWPWWRAGATAVVLWWYLDRDYPLWIENVVYDLPLDFLQTAVIATTLLFLWTSGRAEGQWPDHVRTAVAALGTAALLTEVTLNGIEDFSYSSYASGRYLAVAIAALGFLWLFPPAAEPRARRLHRTTHSLHTRRVYALLKDQTLAASRREFLTASRAQLSDGSLTTGKWSARWRELGGANSRRPVALRLVALGTSGGRTAWANGMAAAVLLAVLSTPWFLYTLPSRLMAIGYDMSDVVEVWSTALRWPLYGFVFGYAYAWLRGTTPITKALCLLAVVLPAELAELLYRLTDAGDFGIQLLLTSGDTVAVLLLLGLYWEARLVRAAGLRWGQIRNFRSLSATAVPATTVLVAAATALATAMVGVWVTPDTGSGPEDAGSSPSASASPTPGH
ncbi:hypothetical protein ABZ896_40695 [Streptomyces sp. NPDC047072]|uniref:hypothetical protein n=1 Tax=Streptomyces sp. NPDC047072 TaxID=3154809 RepID=UPI003407219E